MPTEVVVPAMGESITSATLLHWHKRPGEQVRVGDVIAELETDKAVVAVECPENGVVLATLIPEGQTADVGRLMAVIGEAGETWTPSQPPVDAVPGANPAAAAGPAPAATPGALLPGRGHQAGVRSRVSRGSVEPELPSAPSARRLARELGIDIRAVARTLGGRRVTEEHVREYHAREGASQAAGRVIALSRIRAVVAQRMTESARSIPQFSVSVRVDATAMEAARARTAQEGRQAGVTAYLVWAACRALDACPLANARYLGDGRVHLFEQRNVAIAVATDDGLVAPVIRDAGGLSVLEIAAALAQLVQRARAGRLEPGDQAGATFTISNLGALGAHQFTPMVVPGQSAILGVGAVEWVAGTDAGGGPRTGPVLVLTMAADHRVLDGADAMRFLGGVKTALETL